MRVAVCASLAALALCATAPALGAEWRSDSDSGVSHSSIDPHAGKGKGKGAKRKGDRAFPWEKRLRAAIRYTRHRIGRISFAVVDGRGRIHGFRSGRRFSSASLVKAMLMVAYLRQRNVKRRRLHAFDRRLLGPMIRASDNGAATAVQSRVGTGALRRLARRARMRGFIPNPVWGGSQITARDQARFFFRIRGLVPDRHAEYALGLLRRIVPRQRWGIPRAAPPGFTVHFKGGWYRASDGWRVHQAALLRDGDRRLSIAVLSDGDPNYGYGQTTIQGITALLLRGYPSAKR